MGAVEVESDAALILFRAPGKDFRFAVTATSAQKDDVPAIESGERVSEIALDVLFDVEPFFGVIQWVVGLFAEVFTENGDALERTDSASRKVRSI